MNPAAASHPNEQPRHFRVGLERRTPSLLDVCLIFDQVLGELQRYRSSLSALQPSRKHEVHRKPNLQRRDCSVRFDQEAKRKCDGPVVSLIGMCLTGSIMTLVMLMRHR